MLYLKTVDTTFKTEKMNITIFFKVSSNSVQQLSSSSLYFGDGFSHSVVLLSQVTSSLLS